MKDPKEEIKDWLRNQSRDREWLADKLEIKKRTVDNWLSSPQEIPKGKLTQIERLMQDDAAAEAQRRLQLLPQAQIFSLEVDLPTFRAYSAAALAADKTLEQWAIAELNAAAEAAMPEIVKRQTNIAGKTLTIIGPAKYSATAEENLRVAEEPQS